MAEFVGGEPISVGIDEPITFENKTDTAFNVSCGIVFRKSGLYRVSIVGRRVSVAVEPEIIHCKDCIHRPTFSEDYDPDAGDSGLSIIFPDFRCPCWCEDPWYNRMPEDDWFCGNGERKR